MSEVQGYQAHAQQGILLNANENPDNLPDKIVSELQAALPDVLFNRYPEDSAADLRSAYGRVLKVDPAWIIAGNGSDQMLQLLIGAFGQPGDSILTFGPDFGMYDFYAQSFGKDVIKYSIDPFSPVDITDLADTILDMQPALVLFSNPNNPYGTMIPAADMKKLADLIAPIPLAADEAYMEFGRDSVLPYLETTPNLYITRTLSKAYGLAGLRVGFLISQPENIEALQPHKIVYNLSSLSMKAAEIALKHTDVYEAQVQEIIAERDRMKEALSALGIVCGPANANYLCLFPEDPQKLCAAMTAAGIQIRSYGNKPYIRITIGRPEDNERVLQVVREYVDKGEV